MRLIDRDERGVLGDPGVGKNNVQPALFLLDLGEKTVQIVQLGYIALNSRDIRTDPLHSLVELRLFPAVNKDLGALPDELLGRCCEANPAVTARNECNLPVRLTHEASSECEASSQMPLIANSAQKRRAISEGIRQRNSHISSV
jgi:hypothetical protein